MKHFIIKNGCKVVCISAIALSSLSSCMKDDLTNCPAPKVSLKFDYTYNVENADAFSQEVKNLNVYVFDKNGKYFDTYTQSADKFETGHSMDITDLQEGKYTFVCLARDKKPTGSRADGDDEMEFSFTQLTPGVSTICQQQEVHRSLHRPDISRLQGQKGHIRQTESDEMYQDLPHRDASLR